MSGREEGDSRPDCVAVVGWPTVQAADDGLRPSIAAVLVDAAHAGRILDDAGIAVPLVPDRVQALVGRVDGDESVDVREGTLVG